jgi:hypothetical protein
MSAGHAVGDRHAPGGSARRKVGFLRQCGKPYRSAHAAKLRLIGACAIVGANNYQSLHSLAEFKIPDLIDRSWKP